MCLQNAPLNIYFFITLCACAPVCVCAQIFIPICVNAVHIFISSTVKRYQFTVIFMINSDESHKKTFEAIGHDISC